MGVPDIEEEMCEIYEIELSTSAISIITNKVNQAVQEWQNRPLDPVYLIVWMDVLTDLKVRGVQDILITCIDNLNGFTDTIRTVFPQSSTQIYVVHQIRNSCKYVVYKDKKESTADMKNIYNAPNKEVAATELDNLEKK